MFEEQLKALAEELKTELITENIKVQGLTGSVIGISTYKMNVAHENESILITNELGNHNLGHVTLNLNQRYFPDFEITAIDHFMNLFLRRKDLLKIKCQDSNFKSQLEQIAETTGLQTIARNNSFEPKITAYKEQNRQIIQADYSLQFEDKIGGLRALIRFYQELIDLE